MSFASLPQHPRPRSARFRRDSSHQLYTGLCTRGGQACSSSSTAAQHLHFTTSVTSCTAPCRAASTRGTQARHAAAPTPSAAPTTSHACGPRHAAQPALPRRRRVVRGATPAPVATAAPAPPTAASVAAAPPQTKHSPSTHPPSSQHAPPDGSDALPTAPNPHKAFVKQLRTCQTLQHISEALEALQQAGVEPDAQAVSALGSTLSRLAHLPASHPSHFTPQHPSSTQPTSQQQLPAAGAHSAHAAPGGSSSGGTGGVDSRERVVEYAARVWAPLLLAQGSDMDAIGFSVCMHAAAVLRLHRRLPTLPDSLAQACMASLPGSSPRVQATVLWALGQMGYAPPQPWLRVWARASMQALRGYTLRDLGMAAGALARVGWTPPEAWTGRMLGVLRRQVMALQQQRWQQQQQQQQEQNSFGSAAGGVLPPGGMVAVPQSTAAQQQHEGDVRGCAQQQEVQQRAGGMQASAVASSVGVSEELRNMALLLWASGKLKVLPEPQTLDTTLDLLVDLMRECTCALVASQAPANLGSDGSGPQEQQQEWRQEHQQQQEWRQEQLQQQQKEQQQRGLIAATVVRSAAMTAWALTAFQHRPTPGFIRAFYASTAATMHIAEPQELALCMMASSNWRPTLEVPRAWMARALQRCAACMHLFTDQGLLLVLDAVAQSGHRPPAAWMSSLCDALLLHSRSLPPASLAHALACLGALRYQPAHPALRALLWRSLAPQQFDRDAPELTAPVPVKRWAPGLLAGVLLGLPGWCKPAAPPPPPATTLHPPAAPPFGRQALQRTQGGAALLQQPVPHHPHAQRQPGHLLPSSEAQEVRQLQLRQQEQQRRWQQQEHELDVLLHVASSKLGYCSTVNLAHMVWALVLWDQHLRRQGQSHHHQLQQQVQVSLAPTQPDSKPLLLHQQQQQDITHDSGTHPPHMLSRSSTTGVSGLLPISSSSTTTTSVQSTAQPSHPQRPLRPQSSLPAPTNCAATTAPAALAAPPGQASAFASAASAPAPAPAPPLGLPPGQALAFASRVLSAARQKLALAPPGDLVSLVHGLAALLGSAHSTRSVHDTGNLGSSGSSNTADHPTAQDPLVVSGTPTSRAPAPAAAEASVAGGSEAAPPLASPPKLLQHDGAGLALSEEQLTVLLEAVAGPRGISAGGGSGGGVLPLLSLEHLVLVLESLTQLGATCVANGSRAGKGQDGGKQRRAVQQEWAGGWRAVGQRQVSGGVDGDGDGDGIGGGVQVEGSEGERAVAQSVPVLMRVVARRCLQLLLEQQQALAAAAQRTSSAQHAQHEVPASLPSQHAESAGSPGVRQALLHAAAAAATAEEEGSGGGGGGGGVGWDAFVSTWGEVGRMAPELVRPAWVSTRAWAVLLKCGYVQCLGRVQQQQACCALYAAVEQQQATLQHATSQHRVVGGGSDGELGFAELHAWWRALAARMPVRPPVLWMDAMAADHQPGAVGKEQAEGAATHLTAV